MLALAGQSMIDYGKFRSSLKGLEEQHENHLHHDPSLTEITRNGIAESVIQRFEICYDCLWKVLKRYLFEVLRIDDPPNSPKPVLRLADEANVLPTPLAHWLRYANARTSTSHDYDCEKADACLVLVPDFLADAIKLYVTMSGDAWK
ncbi:MAG: nucleotidyltransferase substrate binding protein [Gammaproteobacteria bacterium]|nr:nucleotidyltransferase substrate binding protein [Gammaproteobacteria bacterium]